MVHRGYFSAQERQIRSQLTRIVSQERFIRAGIVKMSRKCGKQRCRCVRGGGKHVSYYLSLREGSQRKMIYIPSCMEVKVRHWVVSYKEIKKGIDKVSAYSLKQLREG